MTVIVVTAMDEEAQAVVGVLDRVESEGGHAGAHRWYGELAGHEVVLVRCGIGLVNAAASTAAALEQFAGRDDLVVISAGTAGGVGADVRVGDVIVAESTVHGDVDVRAFDYALGQVPGMPAQFAGHDDLVPGAVDALAEAGLPVRRGAVVSTDSFVTPEKARRIISDFPVALSVDMESSAIAHVAHRYAVPFVSVRVVSDLADDDTGQVFDENLGSATSRAAEVVAAIIRRHTA